MPTYDALASCGLSSAWANQPSWTLLDTDFQNGQLFLQTLEAWRSDPYRPRMLHYVGIAHAAPHISADAVLLAQQCQGLESGFRRMHLEAGHVSLTLCVGPLPEMLKEQVFRANTVFAVEPNDKWAAELLARFCKRGTRLSVRRLSSVHAQAERPTVAMTLLTDAGFQLAANTPDSSQGSLLLGRFDPNWQIPTSRSGTRFRASAVGRCAVIGAGISGASIAHALALRGWQVSVFDQEKAPAQGASGLPAGLAVPHVSLDDSPRSRLSRSGTHLTMQHAAHYLDKGQDWAPSGVLERKPGTPDLWHPMAAWIKPAKLVQAWLAQPGITFTGQAQIARLGRHEQGWQLFDSQEVAVGAFEVVVLANALGCAALLKPSHYEVQPSADVHDKLAALQAVHGTLSHGTYAEALADLPTHPVNGNGCFIPHVSGSNGAQWVLGSTYETDALVAADLWAQHTSNLGRLEHLLPETGKELAQTLDRGPVAMWSSTRCVTHDRMPLIGPVSEAADTGLWLCVGMGSRGLSFAALCADLLVARLGAEPLPMEVSLARSLDVHRPRRHRALKKTAVHQTF